jgi:AhpD family alkylhydroperoxidase
MLRRPAGVKALGAVYGHIMQSGLPKALVDLVYLRVSQINGCAYCIAMHSHDLLKEGMTIEKFRLVSAWREGGALFDDTERAALAWAETVTRVAETGVPDTEYKAAAAVSFDDASAVSPGHCLLNSRAHFSSGSD